MTHNRIVPLALIIMLCPGLLGGCAARTPYERLKWKADEFFDDKGVIALCKAIEKKNIAEIDRLAKSGVNVNAKGRGNMTPLLWAFPAGEKVFKRMLELGADPNVTLTEDCLLLKGKSVTFACVKLVDGLMYNQYFYDVPMDNYLKLVLKHGGNPNATDLNGETPLFSVKETNRRIPEKIRLLLDAGADINRRDYEGKTPLISAVVWRKDYILCLLKAGADYRIVDYGGSDAVLWLDSVKRSYERNLRKRPNDESSKAQLLAMQPVLDWLANEGVNWKAARAAIDSPKTMANLKNLPADYKHRPWLPQRPTLKKPDDKQKK